MGKMKTLYGLYATHPDRTQGVSKFFETYEEAENHSRLMWWDTRIIEQTYELEEDQNHDCGDDE